MAIIELSVPDLGNFADVPVVDVLIQVGEALDIDAPLCTLETDKATMDVPASAAGIVREVLIRKGDKVSKGSLLARIETAATQAAVPTAAATAPPPSVGAAPLPTTAATASAAAPGRAPVDREADLVVIGAGPGGYTAAFRAADLGLKVVLIERWPMLGGVCLNVGCIPSKALLHAAKVIDEAAAMAAHGITFGKPQVQVDKLRHWKESVVGRLVGGLKTLASQRKVEVLQGVAQFADPYTLTIAHEGATQRLRFKQCIIAAGSEPVELPFAPKDARIIDSTGALQLTSLPRRMLVIGGGIIGLEMACVYEALGCKVSVVELTRQLMPGADLDLVRPLEKRIRARYEQILLGTKVTAIAAEGLGIRVSFEGPEAPEPQLYDKVLVAVGRRPNGKTLAAQNAGLQVDERGYIPVDKQQRSNQPHIFAIGDIVGQPMLAHKATHEAKVAAEVAAGHKRAFDARVIPSVAYTDPEVAWVGITETEAKAQNVALQKGVFPWAASGRALALGRDEGLTKLLFDPVSRKVLGGGVVGPNAGELISEIALAVEMGADAADIGLTIHPHPTLSETVAMGAEAFEGTLTDLYIPKKR
jgi:dihydrolipoamide dehydrogenase